MIFSRKYVFETKKTRALRLTLNALFLSIGFTIIYALFLMSFIVTASSEQTRLQEGLYQKAPDAIVVFTGDKGRMRQALDHIRKWPEAKLFISGVHGANTFKMIIAGNEDVEALLASPVQVDIDYEAMDTLGNVRETLEHLEKSHGKSSRVLVVTSDYHVLRVRMIFRNQSTQNSLIFYDGIKSNWSEWNNLKKLILESLKTIRAWFLINLN